MHCRMLIVENLDIISLCFVEGMMANVDGMFNVTATYEDDADIHLPYGFYYKREKTLKNYLPPNTNRYCRASMSHRWYRSVDMSHHTNIYAMDCIINSCYY